MNTVQKAPSARRLTSRQIAFAQLVAVGETQSGAYRRAYKHPRMADQRAAEKGCKLARNPRVAAEIARIRDRREVKKLLTLNDRLEILADIAQDAKARPHEKARAIEVYSKISGDQAPERVDHTVAGPNGGPIPVAATAVVSVGRIPVRQRMEMMRAARAAAKASEVKP